MLVRAKEMVTGKVPMEFNNVEVSWYSSKGNSVEGGGRGQESLDGEVSDWRSVCVESSLKRLCCERD